jgi:hypothetical protein
MGPCCSHKENFIVTNIKKKKIVIGEAPPVHNKNGEIKNIKDIKISNIFTSRSTDLNTGKN